MFAWATFDSDMSTSASSEPTESGQPVTLALIKKKKLSVYSSFISQKFPSPSNGPSNVMHCGCSKERIGFSSQQKSI